MSWNDKALDLLKTLWAEGQSCSQISRALYEETGEPFSRNAVIGKIHRLHLNNRQGPARSTHSSRPRKLPPTPEPPIPDNEPDPILIDGSRLTIFTIGYGHCRWPFGDPAREGLHFCGHPISGMGPYCAFHYRRAHQPASPSSREREDSAVAA